jgi:hypothetical protein
LSTLRTVPVRTLHFFQSLPFIRFKSFDSFYSLVLVYINPFPSTSQIIPFPSIFFARLPSRSLTLCPAIEQVSPTVRDLQPDILFSASMWTPEQAQEIREIAEKERPGIKTHAIPQGLQVERGPDGIVEYLLENVPSVLDSVK